MKFLLRLVVVLICVAAGIDIAKHDGQSLVLLAIKLPAVILFLLGKRNF